MLSVLLALAGKGNKRKDLRRGSTYMTGGALMGDDETVWEASVLVLNVATYRYVAGAKRLGLRSLKKLLSLVACSRY